MYYFSSFKSLDLRGEFFILLFILLVFNARSQALLCKTENGKVKTEK